jgi:light-regulated signal transduction histidine kinase (bacteriophytochrome)
MLANPENGKHPSTLFEANEQNCEDEPIRIPGSIQRHGFLLLLNDRDTHVVAASENVADFLEVPLGLILGTPVETILGREILSALKALSNAVSTENSDVQTYLGSFQMRGKFFSVVTHRIESERVLEFEVVERLISTEMTSQVFTNFVNKLSQIHDEQALCKALTEEVMILTGFNRILLYSFDEIGHGTVLCEQNDGTLPSYLNLRFPASDIPQQARDLYVLNTVRTIPDATYVPSPLRGVRERPMGSLDLSMSTLRSVSPLHLEYMRNMGTMSSMSISIVCDGKLWGLVSGHHAKSYVVPYLVRSACDLLTRLVSTQLTSLRAAESLTQIVQFHAVQRRILTQMAAENNYLLAMADRIEDLMHITDAAGVALLVDGQQVLFGQTPGEELVTKLAQWMNEKPDLEVFESRNLGKDLEWAKECSEVASGLLVIRISQVRQNYLMWFRPEVVRTVKWAGEPLKSRSDSNRLGPRQSFEGWKERVRGTSKAWSEAEIASATDFRGAVIAISLKRAEEAVQLGEARFLQLTHALPHPVWTANDDSQITYVNQRWLDQGLAAHGCWYKQERILKEDRDLCDELWHASVANGTTFDLEIRIQPPSNEPERWNLVRAVPYLRSDGSRAGWVGTCTDLTDRRQHEAALKMTEKLALTGRMTSVIAHEINNPLAAITNLLYLLGDHVKGDETGRNYIGQAESELQRISGITKQTLRWSKESEQRADYGTAASLFSDVLQLFAGKIRNGQVNVSVEDGEDVRFFGTAGQLGQVMANLLSNSIQAVGIGGRIWLSSKADGDMMEIIVRDDGGGMSEETLRNLFLPFYSTKGDLGNGLGLYISHEIVERHGGNLAVKSQLGSGTEIRMRLPAQSEVSPLRKRAEVIIPQN